MMSENNFQQTIFCHVIDDVNKLIIYLNHSVNQIRTFVSLSAIFEKRHFFRRKFF